jgi:hypothetical protein
MVCDIDFTQEPDQSLSGGNLTVTNRVDNSSVVLAGQTVEIVSGALVMTAAASSNLSLVNASTRTAALLGAAMTTLWPSFDGHPVRWGAEVTAAPTFDASNRAWGVFTENAVGLGGGNLGAGFSAEIRGTGAGAATRQSRWQGSGGSNNIASLSATAYAAGLMAGLRLDGNDSAGLWSLNADDLDELDTLSAVGLIGAPGGSSGGTTVAPMTRLGVFAVASSASSFVTSIKRLALWVRVARVAS